jgi:hypothetical protein
MRLSLSLSACLFVLPATLRAGESVDYTRAIKPILKSRCYACHGALKQNAKLRLDTAAALLKGGKHGPAVKPGRAAESLLIERVTETDETERMPPEGPPLSAQQVALLKAWIDQGAKAPADEKPEEDPRTHWAFQTPKRPAVPRVRNVAWVRNPIDAFLSAEQEKHGLTPSAPADKPLLLRRVYLDLIGLPPTREELHAFLKDPSPDAYEQVVDRLLASPHYGERWARHWMDVWRYSDWYGRRAVPDVMNSYPQIWRWRDWIIRSLNQDKGYDRMIVEMLAADEAEPGNDENVVATGFVVRNWFKWNYNTWMRDQVEHTGKAFLGLTLNCAHCHDHKYDPISQEEYFRFRAFFEPLELRHERVEGEPDPGPFEKYVYGKPYGPIKSGLIRVFDEKLDAQTFFYTGGDERNKVEGRPPMEPGAPAFLGGDRLRVEPVPLPLKISYPGIQPFVQREETQKREQAVQAARAELIAALEQAAAAQRRLVEFDPLTKEPRAEDARTLARHAQAAVQRGEARLASAEADLLSIRGRIAADNAKYQKAPGNAEELARAASKAERTDNLALARENALKAEQALAAATFKKDAAGVTKAQQQLTAAQAAVAAAQKAAEGDNAQYSPLSPVYPATSTGRRLALARWIANRDNPLTARVAVNHLWGWHFGRPLVETTFNFGRNGKPPSHPELLDWLAVELMDHDWGMKHLHRLIVTSNAYRKRSSAGGDNPNVARDPDNHFLWRFNAARMEAEVVRDSVLSVAGELDAKLGGPEIDHAQGLVSKRRSLYFAHHGESKMEFLELFDGANACDCYARTSSILPQQALALANSELTRVQGSVLARKLWEQVTATGDRETAFVEAAFEQMLARPATAREVTASVAFLRQQVQLFGEADSKPTDPAARAREDLVQALFSHNDFVTIR